MIEVGLSLAFLIIGLFLGYKYARYREVININHGYVDYIDDFKKSRDALNAINKRKGELIEKYLSNVASVDDVAELLSTDPDQMYSSYDEADDKKSSN